MRGPISGSQDTEPTIAVEKTSAGWLGLWAGGSRKASGGGVKTVWGKEEGISRSSGGLSEDLEAGQEARKPLEHRGARPLLSATGELMGPVLCWARTQEKVMDDLVGT